MGGSVRGLGASDRKGTPSSSASTSCTWFLSCDVSHRGTSRHRSGSGAYSGEGGAVCRLRGSRDRPRRYRGGLCWATKCIRSYATTANTGDKRSTDQTSATRLIASVVLS